MTFDNVAPESVVVEQETVRPCEPIDQSLVGIPPDQKPSSRLVKMGKESFLTKYEAFAKFHGSGTGMVWNALAQVSWRRQRDRRWKTIVKVHEWESPHQGP